MTAPDLIGLLLLIVANLAAVFYAGYCAGKERAANDEAANNAANQTPITPHKEQRTCPP
jgi:hypothetical protein